MEKKIDIVPIFNQSVGNIWSDFTHIEMRCDREICGYIVDSKDAKRIKEQHAFEWKHHKYKFAFGAYDGDEMVGFASGYREDAHDMYLHNLYVLPEYNGMGIGKRLLNHVEVSSSFVADYLTLVSLSNSVDFYKHMGYAIHDRRNCEKKLKKGFIGVVPVFRQLNWLCAKMKTDYDAAALKQCKNAPVFAYVSLGYEIDGIGARTKDGLNTVWINERKNGMRDFYERQLYRALEKAR